MAEVMVRVGSWAFNGEIPRIVPGSGLQIPERRLAPAGPRAGGNGL
ncbi:hypothetical protein FHS43_000184 [Streptosporangium becharense]|uniref:Uncharacterized protein n=1 Tax=Streptosporangium becharense TaxID=1816182 RepID=A0A7W9IHA4_9ACTN|nr:hypothetical protein [Streptosporangium becharense]MBB2908938.1 hypothetical protein [Streptosporangium becharense]MBB5820044.1 hypothetical protein [Streptosporangium becharense]